MVAGACDRGDSFCGRQEKKCIRQDAASKDMTLVTYFIVKVPILKSPNPPGGHLPFNTQSS